MMDSLRIIMGATVLFILLTIQALFFLSRCKLRFELAIPICLMLDMLILLVSGILFSNLLIGLYLIIGFSVVGILAIIFGERKHLREFCMVFCSTGFVAFVVGYVFSWAVSLPHVAYAWDDYGHWLPFVKQMVTYNKLYSEPEVYLIRHWYYTPAMPLLEYFACKLVGGYSAGVCFSMGTLVIFVSVLPFIKWFNFNSRWLTYVSIIIVFLSTFITGHEDLNGYFIGFGSAYVDIQLTSICTLLLFWGLLEEDSLSKSICMSIIAVFLSLVKVTGIMFSLLATGTYVLTYLAGQMFLIHEGKRKKGIAIHLQLFGIKTIPVFAAILAYLFWNIVSYPDIEYSSLLGISMSGIAQSVSKYGLGLTYRTIPITSEWFRTYFYHFFTTKFNSTALLPVSVSFLLLLFIFVVYFKCRYSEKNRFGNVKLAVFGLCLVLGLFVYILAVGLVFYSLSENLESMTSYQRYLSSYVGILMLVTVVFGLMFLPRAGGKTACAIILLVTLLMPTDMIFLFTGEAIGTNNNSHENRSDYSRMELWGENINEHITDSQIENPKIYLFMDYDSFPDTPSLNGELAVMSYFLLPTEMQDFGQFRYDYNPSLPFCNKSEWTELLQREKFSYVLISNFFSESMVYWKAPTTQNLAKMYDVFDVPPEELSFNSPLLFEVYTDNEGNTRLGQVLVENPIV